MSPNFLFEHLSERRRTRERRQHRELVTPAKTLTDPIARVFYDAASKKQGIDRRREDRRAQ